MRAICYAPQLSFSCPSPRKVNDIHLSGLRKTIPDRCGLNWVIKVKAEIYLNRPDELISMFARRHMLGNQRK